ncbi:tolA domain protein [Acinetobacter baumannii 1571545]|nr:tolA domain protein [Acinetobacter baumannii 1571545]
MQGFIKSLFIRIFLGVMPVTAYADQKCYGDIIVFHKYDDQMIYPYGFVAQRFEMQSAPN